MGAGRRLVAIHHETWEEIQFGLTVGQEVIVDVFRVLHPPPAALCAHVHT